MFKFLIGTRLTKSIVKKLIEKFLIKKLGDNANVAINKLFIEENNGRLSLSIDVNLDISIEQAENIINQL